MPHPFDNPRKKPQTRRASPRSGYQKPLGSKTARRESDQWTLIKKDVYVEPPMRHWPAWLLPLASFALIVLFVFVIGPTLAEKISGIVNPTIPSGAVIVDQFYDDDTVVVQTPVADLLDRDDIKGVRLAQALYNEPVQKTGQPAAHGFLSVRLSDGTEGFLFSDQVTDRRESIEPAGFLYKIVISAPSRRVMTHASKGTLIAEVMMGTILMSDYRGDGIYRVRLPGGEYGWISDEGTIALGVRDSIQPAKDLARYFVSSAMAFHRVTRLENGLSVRGASSAGIACIAARINGVELPRTLADLARTGKSINLQKEETSSLFLLNDLKAGDLLFFAAEKGGQEPAEMGIVMTDGQILMSRRGWTSIRLIDLSQHLDLHQLIIGARRFIQEPVTVTP